MLWLCLDFPRLSLEAAAPADPSPEIPLAIVSGERPRRLHALNGAAQAVGLQPGLAINSAYAVAPRLRVIERKPEAEQAALSALASWAGQFSPTVVCEPPAALLLEVAGCLRLFGGSVRLLARAQAAAQELGYSVQAAIAPSPAAALLLAMHLPERIIEERSELLSQLRKLPLAALALDDRTRQKFRAVGCRRIADVLDLPRDGLLRRHGKDCLNYLDRLCGLRPDPRQPHVAPPHYRRQLELPTEIANQQTLLFGFQRLLGEFCGYLRGRDCGVLRLQAEFRHAQDCSELQIGLVAPSRDPKHLLNLLRERMEASRLAAPVRALGLAAHEFGELQAPQTDLLNGGSAHPGSRQQLLERLSARLGSAAVHGLTCRPDHRPELAYSYAEPGAGSPGILMRHQARPLWLLDPVRSIARADLQLLTKAERLESGWWDETDIGRDYHQAISRSGQRLWVFRKHGTSPQWFVHGLFA